MRAIPAAWLFREVAGRFAKFATAHIQERCCPRGDSFKNHFERLLIRTPLNRFYSKCVAGGGCFGRARSAPPCGGPGEFHYPHPAARERAEAQREVMAVVAALLAEAEKVMRLHADAPKETIAAAMAEFNAYLTPALREKAAAIRNLCGV